MHANLSDGDQKKLTRLRIDYLVHALVTLPIADLHVPEFGPHFRELAFWLLFGLLGHPVRIGLGSGYWYWFLLGGMIFLPSPEPCASSQSIRVRGAPSLRRGYVRFSRWA